MLGPVWPWPQRCDNAPWRRTSVFGDEFQRGSQRLYRSPKGASSKPVS